MKGCLLMRKISQNQICYVCDITNNYFKVGPKCEEQKVENCKIPKQNGNCLLCDQNYYFDLSSNKCTSVQEDRKVENCDYYDNKQQCERCKEEYKLSEGNCTKTASTLTNCLIFDSQDVCQQCQPNYLLQRERTCVKQEKCMHFSQVKCLNCQEEYSINLNLYFNEIYSINTSQQTDDIANQIFLQKINPTLKIQKQEICQKINVPNCSTKANASECSECNNDYYLNESTKQCIKNPKPLIYNCLIYDDDVTCQQCNNGYKLSNNSCHKITEIKNCQIYDGTVSYDSCLRCEDDYYLQNNLCFERQNKNIANCEEKDIYQDKCYKCQNNYIISVEGGKCFNQTPNCKAEKYAAVYDSSDKAICIECDDTYYLKKLDEGDVSCEKGSVNNCKKYNNDDNLLCEECMNEYYLKQSSSKYICEKHKVINNCEEYDSFNEDQCKVCKEQYFNFYIRTGCFSITKIDNCVAYKNTRPIQCETCASGFIQNSGNTKCIPITIQNCAKAEPKLDGVDSDKCIECSATYALKSDQKSCIKAYSAIDENCAETNIKLSQTKIKLTETQCLQCEQDYLPLNHQGKFMCIENNYLVESNFADTNGIANCLKIDKNKACVQCLDPYFLKDINGENKCVAESDTNKCTLYYRVKIKIDETTQKKYVEGYNICNISDTFSGCEILANDLSNANNDVSICVKCQQDYLTTIKIDDNSFSNVDINVTKPPFILSHNHIQPKVNCESSTSDQLVENCQYYNSNKQCSTCKFGYTGIIETNKNITQCIDMINLITDKCKNVQYENLTLQWQKLFSCHECSDPNQIPVLWISQKIKQNSIEFNTYDSKNFSKQYYGTTSNKSIQCMNYSINSFNNPNADGNVVIDGFGLVNNCGLLMAYTVKSETETPTQQTAPFCIACKPGFQPTLNDQKVQSCTQINNCSGKQWFNSCSQCDVGYVYKISNNSINYNDCIEYTVNNNCFAAELSNSELQCAICKLGFNLNTNLKICESFKPPKCSSSNEFNLHAQFDKEIQIYGIYKNQLGLGCSKCTDGFTAVEMISPKISCTLSQSLKSFTASESLIGNSTYIKNCTEYTIKENASTLTYLCKKCKENTVIDNEQRNCYADLKDCEKADGQGCILCQVGFAVNKDQNCQKGNIPNCQKYNREYDSSLNGNSIQVLCLECNNEYYLNNDKSQCIKGNVKNCSRYFKNEADKCQECLENFALRTGIEKDYCYPIESSLNCIQGTIISDPIFGAVFNCSQCKEIFQILTNQQNEIQEKTTCIPFNKIENCETYEIGTTLNESSFNCASCNKNYYLKSETECAVRINNEIPNCKEYQLDKDECKECQPNYYLSALKTQCKSYPNGISGCRTYKDNQNCKSCDKDLFLDQGKCVEVDDHNKIDNCFYYKTGTICEECSSSYIIQNNLCVKQIADDCKEFASTRKCSSCNEGYVLETDNEGITSCKVKTVSNCLQFRQESPYQCIKCDKDYYNEEGSCIEVDNKIENCLYYTPDKKCEKCESGSVLDTSENKCLSEDWIKDLIPENCEESIYIRDYVCTICKPNYYFNENNECTKCVAGDGCFACYPENPEKCFVCEAGYDHDINYKCIKRTIDTVNPTNPTDNPDTKDIHLLGLMWALSLIWQFY